jgi:hypothetical protein
MKGKYYEYYGSSHLGGAGYSVLRGMGFGPGGFSIFILNDKFIYDIFINYVFTHI